LDHVDENEQRGSGDGNDRRRKVRVGVRVHANDPLLNQGGTGNRMPDL